MGREVDRIIVALRERMQDPQRRTDHAQSCLQAMWASSTQASTAPGQCSQDEWPAPEGPGSGFVIGCQPGEPLPSHASELSRLALAAVAENPGPESQMAVGIANRIGAEIQRLLTEPAPMAPAHRVDAAGLAGAEMALGLKFPGAFRTLYSEVSDGGFGPDSGLLSLARIVGLTTKLRRDAERELGMSWPPKLIALQDYACGTHCLDVTTGGVVAWDADVIEKLQCHIASHRERDQLWRDSFLDVAPDLWSWLTEWLEGPSPTTIAQRDQELQLATVNASRFFRAQVEQGIARLAGDPTERKRLGLSDVGWEDEIRRGAGVAE